MYRFPATGTMRVAYRRGRARPDSPGRSPQRPAPIGVSCGQAGDPGFELGEIVADCLVDKLDGPPPKT
jgi:hypothetical protein